MANRLEDLLIKEVSGVDDPANESPGWMVQKAAAAVPALDVETSEEEADAVSMLSKVKEILLGKSAEPNDGKDDEMSGVTKEELTKELDERFGALAEALVAKFAELSKSAEDAEATAAAEAAAAAEAEAAAAAEAAQSAPETGLTADDLAKAFDEKIEAAQAPVLEILEKVLERMERTESALSIRKSLDGQEAGDAGDGPSKPTLSDAVSAALSGRVVELT